MNIYNLHSDIVFTQPDYTRLDSCVTEMSNQTANARLAFMATNYLPSVETKWNLLSSTANTARSNVRSDSQAAVINLQTLLSELNNLRAEYDTLSDADDQETNLEIRALVLGKITPKYTTFLSALASHVRALTDVTIDTRKLSSLVPGLDADVETLKASIETIDNRITKLETDRDTLNNGLSPLEKTDFAKVAQEAVISVESLKDMPAITTPEVELVKLAIEQVKKGLEDIGENITYLAMLNERNRIVDDINTEKANRGTANTELTKAKEKIKLVDSVEKLYDEYVVFTSELAKIHQSVDRFVQLVENENAKNDDKETRFVNAAQPLIDYLKAVD
jgi:hypothetical protein